MSRHGAGDDDVAHASHASDVEPTFVEVDTDVEVIHRGGEVAGVDAVNPIGRCALVVVQHVADHDEIVRVTVVVVESTGFLNVHQFGRVDDVDELETVVTAHPQGVGLGASNKAGDAVGVKNAAGFPQAQPCSVDHVPACHSNAVHANVGYIADHGHRCVVCCQRFPGVNHRKRILGDDADAAKGASEDVGAVVAEGIGRPVGHPVVYGKALVDV